MKLIYLDNHILVLDKPANVATQPDFHETAKIYIKERFNKPGSVFLEPIHRLDKPVSGLVLFARTSKALSRLNESMRKKEMGKIYRAEVEGRLEGSGTLEHMLLHANFRAIVDKRGKPARLHYRTLVSSEKSSTVEIVLETGRYHQIRAQFAAIGHPIIGDQKYGSQTTSSAIALSHVKLSIPHPISREKMVFEREGEKMQVLQKG